MKTSIAAYQIDSQWNIVRANEAFCRAFRCSEAGLIGRDARDLMREDWRPDFRTYVAKALVGVGDYDVTLPMVAPCGQEGWYKHSLEPMLEDGLLAGYRATITPHIVPPIVPAAAPAKGVWGLGGESPRMVWDFDPQPLARAS